ncbi:MAG TPA: LytTR family DNA-binding domain-containing protein [Chitinophagaceae bacterium]|nr:LytTR family DNA-binding domain-containing protein [Chitinophagaceae bacterium]
MLKCVIVDDERKSCKTLSTLIERYTEGITVCAEAASVAEGVRVINEVKPQLVFLDISMPDGTGFDLLDGIEDKKFELIFTTAYSEYAVRAIKMQAADYLLKPIDIAELQQAVANVKKSYAKTVSGSEHPQLVHSGLYQDKIAIPVNGGLEFLQHTDIIHLTAKGSYTSIFCKQNRTILSSHSLKEHEEILPPGCFFRTHHSHIINLLHIKHFHRGDGGYIIMTDNTEIALSRRKRKDFLALFLAS